MAVWEGKEICEIAESEVHPSTLRDRLSAQFENDRNTVPRDYLAVLEVTAAGLPNYVGFGMGLSRVLQLRHGVESHSEMVL